MLWSTRVNIVLFYELTKTQNSLCGDNFFGHSSGGKFLAGLFLLDFQTNSSPCNPLWLKKA